MADLEIVRDVRSGTGGPAAILFRLCLTAAGLLLLTGLGRDEYAARRARLDGMSAEEVERVRRNWDWWRSHPDEQAKLERIHALTTEDPALAARLESYYAWFSALNPSQQREIQALPTAERVQLVERKLRDEQLARDGMLALGDDDLRTILNWMGEWLKRNRRGGRPEYVSGPLADENRPIRERLLMLGFLRFRGGGELFRDIRPEDLTELKKRLSPPLRDKLTAAGSAANQWNLLQRWLVSAAGSEWQKAQDRSRPTNEQLQEIYAQLPREERDALDGMLPDEFRKRLLEQHYRKLRERAGPGGGMGGGGPFPPGPPRGGPDRPFDHGPGTGRPEDRGPGAGRPEDRGPPPPRPEPNGPPKRDGDGRRDEARPDGEPRR